MKTVAPWPAKQACTEVGFADFKQALMSASFNNACNTGGEAGYAVSHTKTAATIAVEQDWPFWAIDRMFKEIAPLVDWSAFMQHYINVLKET